MKSLGYRISVLSSILAPMVVSAEIPDSLKSLAWKNFAQEISDDVTFRAEVRKILPGLKDDKKTVVNKCIAQIVAGKGPIITGTPVDDALAKALRERGKVYAVGESLGAIDRLTDTEFLSLASGGAAVAGQKEAAAEVKVILVSNPSICLDAPRVGRVIINKTGSFVRLAVGLSDPNLVSLESVQSSGSYLHHDHGKILVTTRPSGTQERKGFDTTATFKLIKLDEGKVRPQDLESGTRRARSRATPGDLLERQDSEHDVDRSPSSISAGGNTDATGKGGDRVWRDALDPAEQRTL